MTDIICDTPEAEKYKLSKEQFKEFYNFLNTIKNKINDADIVDGVFRSRTNDLTCIMETQFSYLKGLNIGICNIKKFIKMIMVLDKKSDITITVHDEHNEFGDDYQSLKYLKPTQEFFDNKFVSEDEFKDIFKLDDEDLFLRETLPKNIVANIYKASNDLFVDAIQIREMEIGMNMGYINISTHAKDKQYIVNLKNPFLNSTMKNKSITFTSSPFMFKSNTTFNFYNPDPDQNIALLNYNSFVGDLVVNSYCRSAIVEIEED